VAPSVAGGLLQRLKARFQRGRFRHALKACPDTNLRALIRTFARGDRTDRMSIEPAQSGDVPLWASTLGVNPVHEGICRSRLILCECRGRSRAKSGVRGTFGFDFTGGVRAGIRTRRNA